MGKEIENERMEAVSLAGAISPEEQKKIKRKIDKKTKAFMRNVKDFLKSKNGGVVPPEWELSLILLETYFKQFLQATEELERQDTIIIPSRYGPTISPLMKVQSQAAVRLEKSMAELGLSLKSGIKLDIADPQVEDSPLDMFIKNKIGE